MRLRLVRTAFVFAFLLPLVASAQSQRAGDVTLTVARHDIQGSTVHYRHGLLLDGLMTRHVHPSAAWSPLVAGGIGIVRGNMPECDIQPDGRCAPSGNFFALNTLVGVERSAGRIRARLFAGPALHSGNDATSIGLQGRVALTVPLDELFGAGIMIRATRLPSHHGEALTLWAFGGSVTF